MAILLGVLALVAVAGAALATNAGYDTDETAAHYGHEESVGTRLELALTPDGVSTASDCQSLDSCDDASHAVPAGKCQDWVLDVTDTYVDSQKDTWSVYAWRAGQAPTSHGSDGSANWSSALWVQSNSPDESGSSTTDEWTDTATVCATTDGEESGTMGEPAGDPVGYDLTLQVRYEDPNTGLDVNTADAGDHNGQGLLGTQYSATVDVSTSAPDPMTVSVGSPIYPGDTATVSITRTYLNGTQVLGEAGNTWITVWNPAGGHLVEAVNPTEAGNGTYLYNLTVPTTATTGCQWSVQVNDSTSTKTAASSSFCVQDDPVQKLGDMISSMESNLTAEHDTTQSDVSSHESSQGTHRSDVDAEHQELDAHIEDTWSTANGTLTSSTWTSWRDGRWNTHEDLLQETEAHVESVWGVTNGTLTDATWTTWRDGSFNDHDSSLANHESNRSSMQTTLQNEHDTTQSKVNKIGAASEAVLSGPQELTVPDSGSNAYVLSFVLKDLDQDPVALVDADGNDVNLTWEDQSGASPAGVSVTDEDAGASGTQLWRKETGVYQANITVSDTAPLGDQVVWTATYSQSGVSSQVKHSVRLVNTTPQLTRIETNTDTLLTRVGQSTDGSATNTVFGDLRGLELDADAHDTDHSELDAHTEDVWSVANGTLTSSTWTTWESGDWSSQWATVNETEAHTESTWSAVNDTLTESTWTTHRDLGTETENHVEGVWDDLNGTATAGTITNIWGDVNQTYSDITAANATLHAHDDDLEDHDDHLTTANTDELKRIAAAQEATLKYVAGAVLAIVGGVVAVAWWMDPDELPLSDSEEVEA